MRKLSLSFILYLIIGFLCLVPTTAAKDVGGFRSPIEQDPSPATKSPEDHEPSASSYNDDSDPRTNRIKATKLNVEKLSLVKGAEFDLKVYNVDKGNSVSFQTSNTSVISILEVQSREAVLGAKSVGSATVTVVIRQDGKPTTLQCRVTVGPPAISVKFRLRKVQLTVGASKKVAAVTKPGNSKESPKYTSNNESVATVSSNGKVTVLAPGKAKITAKISNGKTAFYRVVGVAKRNSNNLDAYLR